MMSNVKTKAVIKKEVALKPKDWAGIPVVKVQKFLDMVNVDKDFALVKNKGQYIVEPTRDLCLKITSFFQLSYDTDLINTEKRIIGLGKNKKEVYHYTVKATVVDKAGNKSTGLASAETDSVHTEGREDHDALAKAETRAIKRGIEGRSGLPIINQLILYYFKGFKIGPQALERMGIYR